MPIHRRDTEHAEKSLREEERVLPFILPLLLTSSSQLSAKSLHALLLSGEWAFLIQSS